MRSLPTKLAGVLLLEPAVAEDPRGFFLETFSRRRYQEAGVADEFVQDNQSRSNAGTIRGLHFQSDPGQAKLVRVARGRIWDVVVDIRRSSATFGRHEGFELDDVAHTTTRRPSAACGGTIRRWASPGPWRNRSSPSATNDYPCSTRSLIRYPTGDPRRPRPGAVAANVSEEAHHE